jgi:maleylacetoacetate isomerase
MSRPILYDYWRSSAAYRVRIALNLKGVDYESRQVDLREDAQKSPEYRALNPQGLVPMLEIDGHRLTQSLAIINYLDLRYANQPLIPASAAERAHVVAMGMAVACDIHPLNNLRVLKYLKNELGQEQEAIDRWYAHWISEGLPGLEALAAPRAGDFLFGNAPTGADVCLVPQLYNARRYSVPLDAYPTLLRAEANANKMEAFAAAHPDRQESRQSGTLTGAR